MQKILKQINKETMTNVGPVREQAASKLAEKMQTLMDKDVSKMSPDELKKHQLEINRAKEQYFKIINQISGAQVAELAQNKKQKDQILAMDVQYQNLSKTVSKYLKELERIAEMTEKMNQSVLTTSEKTGMSREDLMNPDKVKSELASITKKDGTAKAGSEEKFNALKEHLKVINELQFKGVETLDQWNEKYSEASGKLSEAQNKQQDIRDQKRKIVSQIIEQAEKEGVITTETKETLENLINQEDARNKNKEAAEGVAAAESQNKIKENIKDTKDYAKASDQLRKSFLGKVTAATLYYIALRNLRKMLNSIMRTIKELDKSITEVAMVTNMNREQA
jgi:hypothetical protein